MEAIYEGAGTRTRYLGMQPEFGFFKMRIIKLGLEKGVDVNSAAKPELDSMTYLAEIFETGYMKRKSKMNNKEYSYR